MESERVSLATDVEPKSMRWVWVVVGVAVGAIVITVFLNVVDRYLDRLNLPLRAEVQEMLRGMSKVV